jgi:chemotaxis protein CheX
MIGIFFRALRKGGTDPAMKAEYINPIVQATYDVLEEVLSTDISRGKLKKYAEALPLHRISVLAGLNGDIEGYVLLSMPLDVVLSIAAVLTAEEVAALDDVAQAALVGLMDTIMEEAVRQLQDADVGVNAAPAALVWGQGLQLSCAEIEAAVIPLQMPLGTVELTTALRGIQESR